MKEPIFCAYAFGGITIDSDGEYIPCCNLNQTIWMEQTIKAGNTAPSNEHKNTEPRDRINSTTLMNLRKELINGDWPDLCSSCKRSEEMGINSMRRVINNEFTQVIIPLDVKLDPKNIKCMSLVFSTKCNAKCMTCNPANSDFWIEEHKVIWTTPSRAIKPWHDTYNRTLISHDYAKKLISNFPNFTKVTFMGGEPTISEEHITFLKSLISMGRSKDIRLGYVTNLTNISVYLFEIWDNFKSIDLVLSIDGYEKVNDYIRYPFKWDKVQTNLRMICDKIHEDILKNTVQNKKYHMSLSCTLSIFNANSVADLIDFYVDLGKQYTWKDSYGTVFNLAAINSCYINYVNWPEFSQIGLLSREYRQECVNKLKLLMSKFEKYNDKHCVYNRINLGVTESIQIMINRLSTEKMLPDQYKLFIDEAKHFITESDKFRNRSIKDYIPELWEDLIRPTQ